MCEGLDPNRKHGVFRMSVTSRISLTRVPLLFSSVLLFFPFFLIHTSSFLSCLFRFSSHLVYLVATNEGGVPVTDPGHSRVDPCVLEVVDPTQRGKERDTVVDENLFTETDRVV